MLSTYFAPFGIVDDVSIDLGPVYCHSDNDLHFLNALVAVIKVS